MPDDLFQEEQSFPPFVGVFAGAMVAAAAAGVAATRSVSENWVRGLMAGAGATVAALAVFAPMRTRVSPEGVTITFGMPGWIRFRIPAADVQGAEPVTYHPLGEFGGWGIRFGREGSRAYTARGNRGVRVRTPRREILIGSARPEELALALRRLMEEHA